MQLLQNAINFTPERCSFELLDAVPPVIWFIRKEMRGYRKGLSLPQFRALVAVSGKPPVGLSYVADFLGVSLPNASRIVSGMVDKGLLSRVGSTEDRRQIVLRITPAGQSVLEGAWAGTQGRLAERAAALEPAERETVTRAMVILKKAFGSLGLPGGGGVEGENLPRRKRVGVKT